MLRFVCVSTAAISSLVGSIDAPGTEILNPVLLVLEGDSERRALQLLLAEAGANASAVSDLPAALSELRAGSYSAVLFPADQISEVIAGLPEPAPLLIAIADRQMKGADALAVMDTAFDCLVEPIDVRQLQLALRRAATFHAMRAQVVKPVVTSVEGPEDDSTFCGMVGKSDAITAVFRMIDKVARHKANVLITGESGTGKELVARAMHDLSSRVDGPFVAINCGAIPANLLESEMFGHCRGAFTDAVRDKPGLFEDAHLGTLFFDEIGELPLNLQVKLLRAIQEEEVRRIGDTKSIKVDVRIIAATLKDVGAAVRDGQFREDLFYRLNVLPVELPPLRDRPEDVPLLVEHFLRSYAEKHAAVGTGPKRMSDEAMAHLRRYPWPGNVRELQNCIERAMVLCEGPVIEAHLLEDKVRRAELGATDSLPAEELSIKKMTRAMEEDLIRKALATTKGNRTNAAKLLEISHRALLYKIKAYGL